MAERYFKIVDAGNFQEYSVDFLNYYYKHQSNFIPKNSFWNPLKPEYVDHCLTNNPDFAKGIAQFGEIRQIAVLTLHDQCGSSLHIDADFQRGVLARLNIPLLNCAGSYTAFFDPYSMNKLTRKVDAKTKTTTWDTDLRYKLKPVAEIELLQPTILRTSSPHTVYCRTCEFPRISLTISFVNDIVGCLML